MKILQELYNYHYGPNGAQHLDANDKVKYLDRKAKEILSQVTFSFTEEQLTFMIHGILEMQGEGVAREEISKEIIDGLKSDQQMEKLSCIKERMFQL